MEETYDVSFCDVKWGSFVFLGLLSLIFGILIMLFPNISATVLVILFSLLIILLSFMAIIMALMTPAGETRSSLLLIAGVLGFLVGVAGIIYPIVFGAILVEIIAIVLFVIGLLNIAFAVSEKTFPHRWMLTLAGILAIIFGVLFMIYPLIGALVLFGFLVGAFFVIYGIIIIAVGVALRGTKEVCVTEVT
ncbi:MAG TPA: DUF308 domain-containing protein [Methanoregulaceae archaeon]|nr:DUF308 domain-containing protein [Methanoregulaceae archaeon]